MQVLATIKSTRQASRALKQAGKRVGFVPTMGALHDGHLSLIRAAKKDCDAVFVSIFVNPLQFAPTEDLAKYPRTLERDQEQLQAEGVDILFAPSVEEMYPTPNLTHVNVEGLSDKLCGHSRPGHFRGVATVVAKLFHIVEPDRAYFGQKDAVQLAVIRRMVQDSNFPVEIVAGPIVREADGLAMSSRNAYLTQQERKSAAALYRSLKIIEEQFKTGKKNARHLIAAGKQILETDPQIKLDYLEIVNPETLDPIQGDVQRTALVAIAAFVGATRLIDNLTLEE